MVSPDQMPLADAIDTGIGGPIGNTIVRLLKSTFQSPGAVTPSAVLPGLRSSVHLLSRARTEARMTLPDLSKLRSASNGSSAKPLMSSLTPRNDILLISMPAPRPSVSIHLVARCKASGVMVMSDNSRVSMLKRSPYSVPISI